MKKSHYISKISREIGLFKLIDKGCLKNAKEFKWIILEFIEFFKKKNPSWVNLNDYLNITYKSKVTNSTKVITELNRYFGKLLDNTELDLNHACTEVLRILWVSAHYSSATAASHGAHIAVYFEDEEAAAVIRSQLLLIEHTLPTSVSFSIFHPGVSSEPKSIFFKPISSKFEEEDIPEFQNSGKMNNRTMVAILINIRDGGIYYDKVAENLQSQTILQSIFYLSDSFNPNISRLRNKLVLKKTRWKSDKYQAYDINMAYFLNRRWNKVLDNTKSSRSVEVTEPKNFEYENTKLKQVSSFVNASTDLQVSTMDQHSSFKIILHSTNINGAHKREVVTKKFDTYNSRIIQCSNVYLAGSGQVFKESELLAVSNLRKNQPLHGIIRHLYGTYFLLPTYNSHHSHMLIETISQIPYALRLSKDINFIAFNSMTSSQREYLEIFDIGERLIFIEKNDSFLVETLIVTDYHFSYSNFSKNFIRSLVEKMPISDMNDFGDRIYFSRDDARLYRNLVNEEQCQQIFKEFGFTILTPTDLSANQKIECVSKAKFIAGPLGAALHYFLFSNSAKPIILYSDTYEVPEFYSLWKGHTHLAEYIKGISLYNYDELGGFHSSYYIDPILLRGSLEKIFS